MPVVLVTGANRGIGRVLAEQFVAAGHPVAGTHRSGGEVPEGVFPVECDITDQAQVDAAFERIEAEVGTVGVLATFTGIATWAAITGVSATVMANAELRRTVPLFVFYGVPLASLFLMLCTLGLGYGWRGLVAAILSWGVLAGGFYGLAWPLLDQVTGSQFLGGLVGITVFFSVACWLGWLGFRYARA